MRICMVGVWRLFLNILPRIKNLRLNRCCHLVGNCKVDDESTYEIDDKVKFDILLSQFFLNSQKYVDDKVFNK